jgi:hypothetical protein
MMGHATMGHGPSWCCACVFDSSFTSCARQQTSIGGATDMFTSVLPAVICNCSKYSTVRAMSKVDLCYNLSVTILLQAEDTAL